MMNSKRTIKNPYWTTNQKTQIMCEFHWENGPIETAAVSDTEQGNPDWKEIMEKFTLEEIDKNTKEKNNSNLEAHKIEKQKKNEQLEKMKADTIFTAKLESFEIPKIRDSKNRELKSSIRKARSLSEVHAYTAILLMKELDNEKGISVRSK